MAGTTGVLPPVGVLFSLSHQTPFLSPLCPHWGPALLSQEMSCRTGRGQCARVLPLPHPVSLPTRVTLT